MSSDFSVLSALSTPPPLPALGEELRATFFFEDCTDEQLRWIVNYSDVVDIERGTTLFSDKVIPDALWILLGGEMQLAQILDGRETVLDRTTRPGTWGGWLPQFDTKPLGLTFRVLSDSRFLRVPKESVRAMLANGFPILNHLLLGIMSGSRTMAGATAQQEKLVALGRFSAGLAHELNNPAAAAKRAASDLREALRVRDQQAIKLIQSLDTATVRQNLHLAQEISERDPILLGPIERSEAEEALANWLDDHGIDDGYSLGPSLLDASVTLADLETLAARMPADLLDAGVRWLEAATTADEMSRVIETSVGRISDLVAAIKEYTFMDRDGQQEVNLHQGLDNTLLILNHALKRGVEVVKDYDPEISRVCAFGSELNQVWTNIIDNAVHAMDGTGQLRIRTRKEDDETVLVEITDTGPGIPEEIKQKIFDPFFTTKAVGVGSGLGLDIVRRVVRHHGGDVAVRSQPGETTFTVRLPLEKTAAANVQ